MNTRNRTRTVLTIAAVAMAALVVTSSSAQAAIIVRSTDFNAETSGPFDDTITMSSFTVDPRTGGKLVLAASWESSDTNISATWNGTESFTVAENSAGGRNSALLYLDDPTPGTGNVVVTYGANTGSRVGVVNLTGAAGGVNATSTTTGLSGSLTTPVDDVFVAGVYTMNAGTGRSLDSSPFSNDIYPIGDSSSSLGSAGYQIEGSAGLKTYTWTATNPVGDNNALAGFVEAASSPAISLVNTDSQIVIAPPSKTSTLSFDAGATADKLIVQVSSENSGEAFSVSYNGESLTLAAGSANGRNEGIYYLDDPFTGGAADLTVDMSGVVAVNGIAFGVASVSGSAPGVAATANDSSNSVTISPTVDGSFVMAGWGAQGASGNGSVDAPLTELYGGAIGSAEGGAGYIYDVVAMPQSYSFSGGNDFRGSGAAAFAPLVVAVPEPSAFALTVLGLLSLGMVGWRRRKRV